MGSTAECELTFDDRIVHDALDFDSFDDETLVELLRDGERRRRQLEAEQARLVRELDRRRAFRRDGHASIKGLLRVVTNRAPWEITALVQTSKLLSARPEVAGAMTAGEVGVAQVAALAKVFAHPRCGDKYGDVADTLVHAATTLPFRDFVRVVDRFETIADEDGADQRAAARHRDRDAFFHVSNNGFHADICGTTLAGETAKAIFDAFVQAESDLDWAWVKNTYGDDATPDKLPRTPAQRRFDAFMAILERAVTAAAPAAVNDGQTPIAPIPVPVANVHVDQHSFARVVARTFGITPQPVDGEMLLGERRCETSNGHPLAPIEVAAVLLAGHLRRVVLDSASVVIDMGRKQRLFTGNARIAAHMGQPRCIWPGCEVSASHCQTDHLTPWNQGGTTSPDDGGPLCDRHNLFKQNHGYAITRDPTGRYHTLRPDGTEVT